MPLVMNTDESLKQNISVKHRIFHTHVVLIPIKNTPYTHTHPDIHLQIIPAKFNRGLELIFSDFLQIFTICLLLSEIYFLKISPS